MAKNRIGKVFVSAQLKGGSGKTTTAVSLLSLLSASGLNPLGVDMDSTNTHLTTFLKRRKEHILEHKNSGIRPIEWAIYGSDDSMKDGVREAILDGRPVVIDCNAASLDIFKTALILSDVLVFPNRQGWTEEDAYDRLLPYWDYALEYRKERGYSLPKGFSVLLDYRPTRLGEAMREEMERLKKTSNIHFLGVVPHQERLGASTRLGLGYWEVSKALRAAECKALFEQAI